MWQNPVLIVFATREGHTRRIAEHLAKLLEARHIPYELREAAQIAEPFVTSGYAAAILAASVHRQRHEAPMADFVRAHRRELEGLPTLFLSVSLSEAGAEDLKASPEHRAKAAQDAAGMIHGFLEETGWRPARVAAVAGALPYSRYNFLLRAVMKGIARQAGGDTDTSRDYEYTNWRNLDRLAEDFLEACEASQAMRQTEG